MKKINFSPQFLPSPLTININGQIFTLKIARVLSLLSHMWINLEKYSQAKGHAYDPFTIDDKVNQIESTLNHAIVDTATEKGFMDTLYPCGLGLVDKICFLKEVVAVMILYLNTNTT